jgi:hypothetical protein
MCPRKQQSPPGQSVCCPQWRSKLWSVANWNIWYWQCYRKKYTIFPIDSSFIIIFYAYNLSLARGCRINLLSCILYIFYSSDSSIELTNIIISEAKAVQSITNICLTVSIQAEGTVIVAGNIFITHCNIFSSNFMQVVKLNQFIIVAPTKLISGIGPAGNYGSTRMGPQRFILNHITP